MRSWGSCGWPATRPNTLIIAATWTSLWVSMPRTTSSGSEPPRGVGLVVEATVRVPLIYLLPVSVMVAVSQAMMIAAFVLLIGWTSWYSRRAAARASQPQ
jgi:hypothetical protein